MSINDLLNSLILESDFDFEIKSSAFMLESTNLGGTDSTVLGIGY